MNKDEKTIKVSTKCYKALVTMKKKTNIPIKHIVESLVIGKNPKVEFVN